MSVKSMRAAQKKAGRSTLLVGTTFVSVSRGMVLFGIGKY